MTTLLDDACFKDGGVRRIEVFTGAGSRRRWSPEEKRRIVAGSYAGLESVCAMARRYGWAQTQIFTRRRELRTPVQAPAKPMFVPLVVVPAFVFYPGGLGGATRGRLWHRLAGGTPMLVKLHANAVTTPRTRAYIQASGRSVAELARELGVSETAVRLVMP